MFRRVFLIFLMCAILAGAASTGISFPALLVMGSFVALAFFVTIADGQPQG